MNAPMEAEVPFLDRPKVLLQKSFNRKIREKEFSLFTLIATTHRGEVRLARARQKPPPLLTPSQRGCSSLSLSLSLSLSYGTSL